MFANSSGSDSVETHRGSRKVLHQDGCFVTGTVSWSDLNMTHTENIVGVVNPETSCLRLFDLHAGDNHPLITICFDGSKDVLTMQYARLGSISEDSDTYMSPGRCLINCWDGEKHRAVQRLIRSSAVMLRTSSVFGRQRSHPRT